MPFDRQGIPARQMRGLWFERPAGLKKGLLRRIWNLPFETLKAAFRSMMILQRRYGDRRRFALLDDHLLRDIGVAAQERDRELEKPFWTTLFRRR